MTMLMRVHLPHPDTKSPNEGPFGLITGDKGYARPRTPPNIWTRGARFSDPACPIGCLLTEVRGYHYTENLKPGREEYSIWEEGPFLEPRSGHNGMLIWSDFPKEPGEGSRQTFPFFALRKICI